MSLSISAVVPAYNEENTVALVVSALLDSKIFNEVICVNDGSEDDTQKILENFGSRITLIKVTPNKGKGHALTQGIKKAKTDLVAFIDADFTNLSTEHLKTLLAPLIEGRARASIGCICIKVATISILDHISGQRIYYKKDLMPILDKMEPSKYGVEIVLNELSKKIKTERVALQGLTHIDKYKKYNPVTTIRKYIIEGVEIAKELSNREVVIPSDLKILSKLEQEKNLEKVRDLITRLKNTKIRSFLQKYFDKYFTISKKI